jgi:hypothetical protein
MELPNDSRLRFTLTLLPNIFWTRFPEEDKSLINALGPGTDDWDHIQCSVQSVIGQRVSTRLASGSLLVTSISACVLGG